MKKRYIVMSILVVWWCINGVIGVNHAISADTAKQECPDVKDREVQVTITRLEKQEPSSVEFPMTDTVFKGNYEVSTTRDCRILAHVQEFVVSKKQNDGNEETIVLGSDRHDESTKIIGGEITWPYDLTAGNSVEEPFMIMDINIPDALKKLGYSDPQLALSSPDVRFYIKITADVNDTPCDAVQEADIKVIMKN